LPRRRTIANVGAAISEIRWDHMHLLSLFLAVTAASGPAPAEASHAPENLLAGPARCVLRYLDAVRLAGPRPLPAMAQRLDAREKDYAKAKALTAPRTLQEIARRAAEGEDHPLAPWREAARAHVLESFQLVGVRRAPQGAVVVTVKERFWRPGASLDRTISEYLVARVNSQWKVVDRSPGAPFDDAAVPARYAGFFDAPDGE
jgi:hypothetical protein